MKSKRQQQKQQTTATGINKANRSVKNNARNDSKAIINKNFHFSFNKNFCFCL
jgi:hypothetical protein